MKKLLIALCVLCVGCGRQQTPLGNGTITDKYFAPDGSFHDSDYKCVFYYSCANGYRQSFIDSCYKHDVGDIIRFKDAKIDTVHLILTETHYEVKCEMCVIDYSGVDTNRWSVNHSQTKPH